YNDSTALANYNEALDIMPDYVPAMLGKAETFRITREYTEYFETLNDLVGNKDIPTDGTCDYLTAVVQRADPNFLKNFQSDFDTVMSNALEAHPADSLVATLAGVYYYGSGRKEEAKACFKMNVDNFPESAQAAFDYAEAVIYMGEYKEASEFCKASFEKFPDKYDFLQLAIYADYSLDDCDSVIRTCERLIAMTSDSATVLTSYATLGDMYYKKGETSRAYKAYESALGVNPKYLPVLNNYAYYLSLENKQLKKAAAMSKTTVEAEPDNPTYLDTYGWILYLQGKPADAKPQFKHAMLYGGKDNAVILDHYAEVLYALGEYDLAYVYWNQAVTKDTDGEIEDLQERIQIRKAAANKKK
ncbi:MAG: tetratricopeptide repeat protein, partial [Bacteroidales bacterium]|nr:tetratricopeptide repeat protein [Bacteroidales bacterium]